MKKPWIRKSLDAKAKVIRHLGKEFTMTLKSYRQLEVWQKAMDLVVPVYAMTKELPTDEKYGLISQIRRAIVSIPANIAEGYGRSHRGDYLHHLSIANGSLAEFETLITVVVRLGFLSREEMLPIWQLSQETGRMLASLTSRLDACRKSNL